MDATVSELSCLAMVSGLCDCWSNPMQVSNRLLYQNGERTAAKIIWNSSAATCSSSPSKEEKNKMDLLLEI